MSVTTPGTAAPALAGRARLARTRTVVLTACYALLSLWALVMSGFGPVIALTADLPDPALRFSAVAAGAFKVLTLGPAVAVLLTRGRSVFAVRALLVGQGVWLAADLLAPQDDEGIAAVLVRFVVSTVIWVGPWLLLSPQRTRLWAEPFEVRPVPAALAVLAAGPLVLWARATSHLDVSGTLPAGGSYEELRYDITGLALAVLAALVLAAACAHGAWWERTLATVALVVGALAVVYPDGYGSPGTAGVALVVAATVLATPWARRSRLG